jgi:Leucine-rich repeat (LRR) protein
MIFVSGDDDGDDDQNLTHLNIMSNQFTSLSSCFGNLTNLIELNAAANRLADVPPSLVHLTRLQKLILRDNVITFVPNLQPLTQLVMLDLSNNRIQVHTECYRCYCLKGFESCSFQSFLIVMLINQS